MHLLRLTGKNSLSVAKQAANIIRHGGVVLYPTDTVYGLGCDPFNVNALRKIIALKGRNDKKGMIVLVSSPGQLRRVATVTAAERRLIHRYWPGALTILLRKKRGLPRTLTGGKTTVAVRWPKHLFISKLLEFSNCPLVSTSANRSGKPALSNVPAILKQLGAARVQPDLVIDAGALPKQKPSSIIRLADKKVRVIRQGSVIVPHNV